MRHSSAASLYVRVRTDVPSGRCRIGLGPFFNQGVSLLGMGFSQQTHPITLATVMATVKIYFADTLINNGDNSRMEPTPSSGTIKMRRETDDLGADQPAV